MAKRINKEAVARMKALYPVGTRVELIRMDNPKAPPQGTKGTVLGVDESANLLMRWDNGSRLIVLYRIDLVRKIERENRKKAP